MQDMTPDQPRLQSEAETSAALDNLFSKLPADFESRYEILLRIHHAFKIKLAAKLEPALNAKVHVAPQSKLADKDRLAKWLNSILHAVGLTIAAHDTNEPGLIIAEERTMGDCASYFSLLLPDPHNGVRRCHLGRDLRDRALKLVPFNATSAKTITDLSTRAPRSGRSIS